MGRISKKLLLCLLAVSSLTVSGSVYADSEGSEAATQAAEAAEKSAEPERRSAMKLWKRRSCPPRTRKGI
ncbi:MAG: hypothetical protein J6X85_05000 [Ruminococcus sp.]|nr:hypothetical protein [Ruminococcus sp.]